MHIVVFSFDIKFRNFLIFLPLKEPKHTRIMEKIKLRRELKENMIHQIQSSVVSNISLRSANAQIFIAAPIVI